MMYNNSEFKAMQSGLDMLWLKQKVISDNIANSETPGYKSKHVQFEQILTEAVQGKDGRSKRFQTTVTTDAATSIRPDGNNVDMEKESLELWQTYAQYTYLTQKISEDFKNLRYVITQSLR